VNLSTLPPAEIDVQRYARQILLPEVGGEGQRRIQAARVLIVGAGGLGSPAALYLTAAGVGTLGLVDGDIVERSNLHRQILHNPADIGKQKIQSAREKLSALNPSLLVREHPVRLVEDNAPNLLSGYDLVLDGSDNFETRYAVNDAAVRLDLPLVWGAVLRWEGQVMSVRPGKSACYRCVFPEPPDPALALSCADGGILGPVAGVAGCLMASEALKILLGKGDLLTNRLWLFDIRRMAFRERPVKRRSDCLSCAPKPKS